MLPQTMSAASARLPQTYEGAKTALAECVRLDECQTWADKAAALASYAKQANDDELMRMATRIRDRAIRRAGELLKQIEPNKGGRPSETTAGTRPSFEPVSRTEAAASAGLSAHQAKQAIRVANVPADQFEKLVESQTPPTVTKLAEMGTTPAPKPTVDLHGRDPTEFNKALHFVAEFEDHARLVERMDVDGTIPILTPPEAARTRDAIARIDAVHDRIVTRI